MRKNVQINYQGVSLEGFIKDNEALLTALAVISALIVFSKDLKPTFAGGAVSFLLVGGIVLLWHEMWQKFPEQVTWRLFTFRYVLLWILIGIIFCWLYEYRAVWDIALFIPVTIGVYWFQTDTISQIVNIIPFTRKFFGVGAEKKTPLQKWMRGIAILIGIFVAFYFGVWFSFGANTFLDILKFSILKQ